MTAKVSARQKVCGSLGFTIQSYAQIQASKYGKQTKRKGENQNSIYIEYTLRVIREDLSRQEIGHGEDLTLEIREKVIIDVA